MSHCNTVLNQILKIVPRHEFEALAIQHHSGRSFRRASRWSQFVSLTIAQLTGRHSLRDIVDNVSAQSHRLYHLGSAVLTRSNLSRINENKPSSLYEVLFSQLLKRCQSKTPGHNFRFKNPLYSLDSSTIDLCLSVSAIFRVVAHFPTQPIILLFVGSAQPHHKAANFGFGQTTD